MTVVRALARWRTTVGRQTESQAVESTEQARSWSALPQSRAFLGVFLGAVCLGVGWLVARTPWSPGSVISGYRTDLDVYRAGAKLWLTGHNLYLPIHTMHGGTLPFLYPPLSAILFAPFAAQSFALASVEITVLSVATLAVVVLLAIRSLKTRVPGNRAFGNSTVGNKQWLLLGLLLPVALVFEPVRATLGYGQINLLLMGLVAADCLVRRPKWPRGALVGLAAALKLTPAAFLLFFLVRKDWRAAVQAGVSFVVCTGVGFVLDWHDSVSYWTKVAYQTNRIGLGVISNQSITAMLIRFGLQPPLRTAVWLVLVALLVVVAVLALRRVLAAGQVVLALSLNGVIELLASPISWSHHWVWSIPLVFSLLVLGRRARAVAPLLAGFAGLLLFTFAPLWWAPNAKYWGFWLQLLGNSYAYFGVAALIGAAFLPLRRRATRTPTGNAAEPEKLPETRAAVGVSST